MLKVINKPEQPYCFFAVIGCLGQCVVLAVTVMAVVASAAEETHPPREPSLSHILARRVGFEIAGDPRRAALQKIGNQFRVVLFLDRRLDPDFPLFYRTQKTPLGTALEAMTAEWDAAITWLGPIGYVGPADKVKQLQTLRALAQDQMDLLPEAVHQRLLQKRPLRWDRLSTPQEIVEQVAAGYGLQWKYRDRLPHDLWAAGQLPASDFATQLTLLLAGFDLTFRCDAAGEAFQVVPLPEEVILRRSYAVHPDRQEATIKAWTERFPQAVVGREGDHLLFASRVEDHWKIDPASRPGDTPFPRPAVASPVGQQVYTLRVQAPLESVLEAIIRQAGLSLELQRQAIDAARIDLESVVRLDVQEVTLEELLAQLLHPLGLAFIRQGDQITVMPAAQ